MCIRDSLQAAEDRTDRAQAEREVAERSAAAERAAKHARTERRPKWLLSQVHPDKHPDFSAEATAATARVNQAMDVRSRHVHVTEV